MFSSQWTDPNVTRQYISRLSCFSPPTKWWKIINHTWIMWPEKWTSSLYPGGRIFFVIPLVPSQSWTNCRTQDRLYYFLSQIFLAESILSRPLMHGLNRLNSELICFLKDIWLESTKFAGLHSQELCGHADLFFANPSFQNFKIFQLDTTKYLFCLIVPLKPVRGLQNWLRACTVYSQQLPRLCSNGLV